MFCKLVDVPQVLVEQIQVKDETNALLRATEFPYYSINAEFLDCINLVIANAQKMEQVNLRRIKELESTVQNLEFQVDSLRTRQVVLFNCGLASVTQSSLSDQTQGGRSKRRF